MKSGLENAPSAFKKPVLRDPFLWLFLATASFWALVIWLLFL